mmetsp:Transcript_13800/g.19951  ORF Transcript_13800/g.19951 Transcript_13800/m.19951 type:complete len:118 (-) Transcript_13800:1026-1379(-)
MMTRHYLEILFGGLDTTGVEDDEERASDFGPDCVALQVGRAGICFTNTYSTYCVLLRVAKHVSQQSRGLAIHHSVGAGSHGRAHATNIANDGASMVRCTAGGTDLCISTSNITETWP